MTKEELAENKEFLDTLSDESPMPIAVFDGFEECLKYYYEDESGVNHAVYCYEDLVEHFARENHTTYLEAVEFIDYNTIRSIPYMRNIGGQPTAEPIIIHRINPVETTLDESYFAKDYSDD